MFRVEWQERGTLDMDWKNRREDFSYFEDMYKFALELNKDDLKRNVKTLKYT